MFEKIDKKILFLIFAAALLVGGLIWLAVFVQFGKIKTLSDDIQKEQLDSQVRQERNQKIIELGKELKNIETDEKDMEAMFVDKNDAVPFLEKIEAIATATGNSVKINVIDLSKIKSATAQKPVAVAVDAESTSDVQKESQAQKAAPLQNKKPDFSNQLGFSIELTGESRSLVDFLTKLENLPYFVRVYNFHAAPVVKGQTAQATAAPDQGSPDQPVSDKNVDTTIVIGVYTNGAK